MSAVKFSASASRAGEEYRFAARRRIAARQTSMTMAPATTASA
jgi:hypothetical protein